MTCRGVFFLFPFIVFTRVIFPQFCAFVCLFFVPCTYEHVTNFIPVPQAQHSSAHRNRPAQTHKAAKQVRADQSVTTQPDREHLLHCITASTAQHSASISPHKAAKQVRTCRSECDKASSKRKELVRASTRRREFIQHA